MTPAKELQSLQEQAEALQDKLKEASIRFNRFNNRDLRTASNWLHDAGIDMDNSIGGIRSARLWETKSRRRRSDDT